jgi:riboflavin kinase/FMN adenylyltransferase
LAYTFASIYEVEVPEAWRQKGAWLSIGTFDGVHLGHQGLIRRLVAAAHAENAPAVLVTFFPHPAVVLHGQRGPYYLTSLEERSALLDELGVDGTVTLTFSRELASLTAFEFMSQLKAKFGVSQLLVGYNFALGRGREGDLPTLKQIGKQLGYQLQVILPIEAGGMVVSSRQIRSLLAEGAVDRVAQALGRWFAVKGRVTRGDGRGHSLGIPTANLEIWDEQALPLIGVYAGWAWVGDKRWEAVVNIGVRPTFEAQPVSPRVEAHLLDFDQDLYDRELRLEFVARLRSEQRFSSIGELLGQIKLDIESARDLLKNYSLDLLDRGTRETDHEL